MGYSRIHDSDLKVFEVMSSDSVKQTSSEKWGRYTSWEDFSGDVYTLDHPSSWKSLQDDKQIAFEGMMIGGVVPISTAISPAFWLL